MKRAVTELVQAARGAGLRVSVAEAMDALRAASVAGVERESLREALAAAIVKDEVDRPTFDEVFDAFFAAGGDGAAKRRKRAAGAGAASGR
ncbi:MAG: VWA domain-containing protein, partial [Candidatus Binatia bacterium]